MTREWLVQLLKAYEENFKYYCAKVIRIKNKAGEIVPFLWNDEQEYLNQRAEEQLESQGSTRCGARMMRNAEFQEYLERLRPW